MISKANFVNYISKSYDCAVKNKLHFFYSSIQWINGSMRIWLPIRAIQVETIWPMIIIFTPINFGVEGVQILNFLFDINWIN